ncbi:hypothetical protein GGF46_000155 [Coemansia sp. RSA 552]|nr:hypothetical protein GGF46_000155 [Coemansia sp. RSA 552]
MQRLLRLCAGVATLGVLLLLLIDAVRASSGDQRPQFQTCVRSCTETECSEDLAWPLRLLLWTCESNCDYKCQRLLTERAQQRNRWVHQYHGKWPFVRLWGVQEPASVVFSLLNGYMHVKSYRKVRGELPRAHPMRRWLSVFAVLGSWSWLCSAIFHTRDFPLTEKLDYFSAGLNVLYIFFLGTVRMLRLRDWRQTRIVAVLCAIPYLLHVGYLSLVKFDYGYNMMANAMVGLLSNVVWLVVAAQAYGNGQPKWWKPAVLIVLTDLAFSLEAFDFPPVLDTFDAHSLWHAATIPIVGHWYDYLIYDAKWDVQLEKLRKA